jgi:hypothetical protein
MYVHSFEAKDMHVSRYDFDYDLMQVKKKISEMKIVSEIKNYF